MEYKNLSLEELLKYTHDSAAWYWLGMAYFGKSEFGNAAYWLEKTMNDPDNEWAFKASENLGIIHEGKFVSNASRDKALQFFEKKPCGLVAALHAGLLYYEGTETKRDTVKGKELVEKVINKLIKDDGNDSFLKPDECFRIGVMYAEEGDFSEAIKYLEKTKDRCDTRHPSDRELYNIAEEGIRDCMMQNNQR
jgi:tetratricopeptide (TPR) repeat protein